MQLYNMEWAFCDLGAIRWEWAMRIYRSIQNNWEWRWEKIQKKETSMKTPYHNHDSPTKTHQLKLNT